MQIADTILRLVGKPTSLKHFVKDRPGHDYRYALDFKLAKALGWEPKVGFEQGMRTTVDWYRENDAWWKKRKSADFWDYYRKNYRGLPTDAIPK